MTQHPRSAPASTVIERPRVERRTERSAPEPELSLGGELDGDGTDTDGYLTVWSSTDASRLLDIRIGGGASFAMDVHAGRAIVSSGNAIVLVDLKTGQILRRYCGHHSELRVGRFRTDGQWFATGDQLAGVARSSPARRWSILRRPRSLAQRGSPPRS